MKLETELSEMVKNPKLSEGRCEDPDELTRKWWEYEIQEDEKQEDNNIWLKIPKAMEWNRAWLSACQMKAVRNYKLWKIHEKDGDDEKVKKTKTK